MKLKKFLSLILAIVLITVLSAGALAENTAAAATETAAETAAETAQAGPAPLKGPTLMTEDGVLSIQVPDASWSAVEDPNWWFVLSDGTNVIVLDHQSRKEAFPAPAAADADYQGVFQSYLSTESELFIISAWAVSRDDLEPLIRAVGTIRILKYDTPVSAAPAPVTEDRFGLRTIGAEYYSLSEHLNVRTECSTSSARLGYLTYGEPVWVEGAVTLNERDYGWFRVQYKGQTAYISARFLSPVALTADAPADWFFVYGEDGSVLSLRYLPAEDCWEDGWGRKYTLNGDLYTAEESGQDYASDPAYWVQLASDRAAFEPFTAYGEDGTVVTLFRGSDDLHYDEGGNVYRLTRDTMYVRENNGILYSTDPGYWGDGSDESDTPVESADSAEQAQPVEEDQTQPAPDDAQETVKDLPDATDDAEVAYALLVVADDDDDDADIPDAADAADDDGDDGDLQDAADSDTDPDDAGDDGE